MRHEFDFALRSGYGCIVSDTSIPGHPPLDADTARHYGAPHLLCETIDRTAAERVMLCWEYCRILDNATLRQQLAARERR